MSHLIAFLALFSFSAYVSLKNKTISLEADLAGKKGELKAIAEAIALTDRKATTALREKRELWQTITVLDTYRIDWAQFGHLNETLFPSSFHFPFAN